MIKAQQKLMEEKGQYVYRRSLNQSMMYERIIAEKYSEFKQAPQNSAEHIRAALDLSNTLLGLVISEVGPLNAAIAWEALDVVNHSSSDNRRINIGKLLAALEGMVND